MEKPTISLLIFCLTACADTAQHSFSLPEDLAALASSPQLACQYEKLVLVGNKAQSTNWYFWRQQQRTETRDALSNQGEIWETIKPGGYYYTRLFYNERVALEWGQGDLLASGSTPSIKQISSIVNPDMLGKELALQGKTESNGMVIESYRGTVNNIATEVDWLPTLQLPARLVKQLPEGAVTLTLSACGKQAQFPTKPITKAELDGFRRLDFTDLGDMEDDPMVHHIEQLLEGYQNN
jgi:hypothetical protein